MNIASNDILAILFDCSIITSMIVQAIKKITKDKELPWNVLTVVIAFVVGGGTACALSTSQGNPLNLHVLAYIICTGWLTALCSMIGYDKVKQLLTQMSSPIESEEEILENIYEEEEDNGNI